MGVDLICDAAVVWGRLKHSWLENQVLNKSPADIIEMRDDGAWEALGQQFPRRIQETLSLAEGLVDGFSPAQIVDRVACFSQMPEGMRCVLRNRVHNAYLARCGFSEHANALAQAATVLSDAFHRVKALWDGGSDGDLERAWFDTLDVATKLRDDLDKLPRGICLP